jgi:predicted anti-sigma-YlaC factor YlaD
MNSCLEIKYSIGAWLDGELSGSAAAAVQAHLASCPDCREEQRQLEKLDSAMKRALESEVYQLDAQAFWRGVRERITAKRPWYAELAEEAAQFLRAPGFAWAVPAVIVLIIGALYFQPVFSGLGVGTPRNSFATVESIDAYGRNVALWRENESRTTVIWIYQNPDSENEGGGETEDKGPAF